MCNKTHWRNRCATHKAIWGLLGTLFFCMPAVAGNLVTVPMEDVRNELNAPNATSQGAMLLAFDEPGPIPKQLLVGAPTSPSPGVGSFVGRVVRHLLASNGVWSAAPNLVTPPLGDSSQAYFGISADRFGDRHMIAQSSPPAAAIYEALAFQQSLVPGLQSPGTAEGVVATATFGSFAAVGVPFDQGDQGRVHLWRFNGSTWVPGQVLDSGANAETGGRFGAAVDMSEDMLLIGTPGEAVRGRVYVYRFNVASQQWENSGELPIPSIYANNVAAKFGFSLMIDRIRGTRALVGAPGAKWSNRTQVTGGASSFDYAPGATLGWVSGNLYSPDDWLNAHQFGFDLDLRDGHALISDIDYQQSNGANTTLGAVFGFDLDVPPTAPVVRVYRYERPPTGPNNLFGYAVRIFGENVVVGAPVDLNSSGTGIQGVVYEFAGPGVFANGFE